jgi:hypothetical protein
MLTVELMIPGSHSLKERRSAVNSLKERIRSRFNVSIADTSPDNVWQRAELHLAAVAGTQSGIDQIFRDVISLMDDDSRCELINPRIEYYA